MSERYAVYYAPEPGSDLELFGRRWLGRCPRTGRDAPRLEVPDFIGEEVYALTRAPRHYGFHGTLVPPFSLQAQFSPELFLSEVERTARSLAPLAIGPLAVREIGSFVAMVPSEARGEVLARLLHGTCLMAVHMFREPPTPAELERRRAHGLSPVQEQLLVRWGYPYVMEEHRFHLTLTDTIPDRSKRERMLKFLTLETGSLCRGPHPIRELCVFHQSDRESPFSLRQRFPLCGDAENP